FGVVADGGAFGNMDVAVDDGAADAAMASHIDVGEKNAGVDFRIGVHAHVRGENAVLDHTAGDDASGGDDGVEGGAAAAGFGENEFSGRILALVGADQPLGVVQVENGGHGNDIHVGFVVGLEGAHVAPVERLFLVLVHEVEGEDAVVVDHLGKNIFAEIVAGIGILGVFQQDGDEDVGIEYIDAH